MALFKKKYRIESNRLKNWDYSSNGYYFITICCANRQCLFGEILNKSMILNAKGLIVSKEIENSIKIRDKWTFHNWIIMPNHIHFLIEIKNANPEYNYSSKRIINDDIDSEVRNLFLNSYNDELFYGKLKSIEDSNNNFSSTENLNNNFLSTEDLNNNFSSTEDLNNNFSSTEESDCSPTQQEKEKEKEKELKLYRRPKSISSFVAQFKSRVTKQINDLNQSKDAVWQTNYHDSIIRNNEIFLKVYYYIKNNPKNWDSDSLK